MGKEKTGEELWLYLEVIKRIVRNSIWLYLNMILNSILKE